MGVGLRFAAIMQIISIIFMLAEIRSVFPFPLFAVSFILTTPDKTDLCSHDPNNLQFVCTILRNYMQHISRNGIVK